MVTRSLRRFLAVLVACAALLAVAPSAWALGGGGTLPSPGGGGGGLPNGGSTQGSSGGPVQGTVGSCSVYATASSFGLSCLTGGSGNARTVKQILGSDPAPTCWDTLVSDADLASKYEYTPNPQAPYYVLSCISGLDVDNSLYNQPNLSLSQKLIEIPANAPDCTRDPKTHDYSDAQKSGADTSCVMVLIGNQSQVTGFLDSNVAQIPGITIATYPSTRVRTQVDTAFVDRADCSDCVTPTRTTDHAAGGVTLYATMDSFKIEPYGPDGPDQQTCDGTADVSPSDTQATKPDACWYTYTHSSNGQPGDLYPFRAEATWSVRIVGRAAPFATFHKYIDLQLPVSDIQTVVVPTTP